MLCLFRIRAHEKIWKIMRLCCIFVMFFVFSVSARSLGQEQVVTLKLTKVSLYELFDAIHKQTGLRFLYNAEQMNTVSSVDVSVKNKKVCDVLTDVLAGTSLTTVFDKDLVMLVKRTEALQQKTKEIKIVGKVTDTQKQPIPGVTVVVKGTTLGAVTDQDGMYALRLPQMKEDFLLIYSFIGMESQEIKYQGKDTINVVLREDVKQVDEVVVTGIFTRKKESFTGSSTTFTTKELKMVGNSNILQSLKTLDPAFAIMENNEFGSDPNHLPNIEIRGKTSVIGLTEEYNTDPNQPLFILDGFESTLATISDLSVDRVASITILKDAAATAIYGAKAANGVVVVETKAPEAGQLRLNYTGNLNFTFADLSDYNLMNAEEKLEYELLCGAIYQSMGPDGYLGSVEQEVKYNNRLAEVRRGVDTYWLNEPLRFATTHKHNVFLEGGDESFRYGIGGSYGKTQGVMKGSDRDVVNGNVRLMYRKGQLSFTNSFNVDYTIAKRVSVPFSKFARVNPYFRKTDENGDPVKILESYSYLDLSTISIKTENVYGPYYDLCNNNFDHTKTFGFTNNFEMNWRPVEELQVRGKIGLNKSSELAQKFSSPFNAAYVGVETDKKGEYTESNKYIFGYDGDLSVTYGKLLAERHMVNAVAGMRFTQSSSDVSGYTMRSFSDDEFSNPIFAQDYNKDKKVFQEVKRRTASYYVNLGYSYRNRYLFDASWRADGASVFGVNKLFTNTWSVGLGWNVHNEAFFEGVEWIDQLKLRASIGNPGNQNFDAYIAMKIYYYNSHHTNPWGVSTLIKTFGNEDLEWQKTLDRNIGFDLYLLDNRLRVNFDYFSKKTDPLLVYVGMPSSTGTTSSPTNVGEQLTKGYTVMLNYAVIKRENVLWSVNATLRHLASEYRDVSRYLDKFNADNKSKNMLRYYDGGSPSDLWAVRSAGIDAITGREIFIRKDGSQTFTHSYDDEVVVGNSDPDFEGVIGTSFYYKGFSISANFRYRVGGQIFLSTLYEKVENISVDDAHYNQDKRALYDRWKQPGDNAKFKAISITDETPMSSRFVADNNVFSGESISMGYESQGKWLRTIGASSFYVRVYMNDIFRVSTVKNERGIDYPFARSVSMSLGLRF
ncbi:SusC/RagA family TonB-linked outer membrane protein [Butyricimonas virosa]|uniref:SusC/RagA family TonB-linked outer membrane protein n=2 Tax=Odoribacteraceae TaxID=1853231 RepID=A0ABX7HAU8_9BACT|nr:SusC/RagA family TonB-linked outer membrane protein [Butyricimonas sp.]QRO52001.1 SusC/RagA family TonB-linked outer membrane protein [Butyricimonas virosa]